MSKQKTTISNAGQTPVIPTVGSNGVVPGAKPKEPEVVALELDDSDSGSDPYNRTGSHCVLKFDE